MMKIYLLTFVLTFLLFPQTQSIFNSIPVANFTLSGFNNANSELVLDGTATKFLIYAKYSPRLQIYSINGTMICQTNYTFGLSVIIWPANHAPILMMIGGNFSTVDQTTCLPNVIYNLWTITKIIGESGSHISFVLKDAQPILTVSGQSAIYEINLNSSELLNSYKVESGNVQFYENIYSRDLSHLYALTQNATSTFYSVRIWETTTDNKMSIKEIMLPENVFFGPLATSMDNKSVIISTLQLLELSTKVHVFDNTGTLTTKIIRLLSNALAITDANLYDAVAFIDSATNSIGIVQLESGQSLQTIYLPEVQSFKSTAYNHRVLILLDDTGRILAYSYQDDIIHPNPDDDGNSSTVWIIIVCVIVGVVIIGAAAFFIRKKKLASKQKEDYGKITDEV